MAFAFPLDFSTGAPGELLLYLYFLQVVSIRWVNKTFSTGIETRKEKKNVQGASGKSFPPLELQICIPLYKWIFRVFLRLGRQGAEKFASQKEAGLRALFQQLLLLISLRMPWKILRKSSEIASLKFKATHLSLTKAPLKWGASLAEAETRAIEFIPATTHVIAQW